MPDPRGLKALTKAARGLARTCAQQLDPTLNGREPAIVNCLPPPPADFDQLLRRIK